MYRRNPNFPTVFLKKEKDPPSPETNEKPLIIYVCCPSKERKNSVIKVGHRKAKPPLASYILSIHVLPLRKVITILEQVLVIISIKRVIRKKRKKKERRNRRKEVSVGCIWCIVCRNNRHFGSYKSAWMGMTSIIFNGREILHFRLMNMLHAILQYNFVFH